MVRILEIFALISTAIAVGLYSFFMIYNLFGKRNLISADVYNSISADIRKCKNASLISVGVAWLYASCQTLSECLSAYRSLSSLCQNMGLIWIIFTFATVVLSVVYGILKKETGLIIIIRNLRKTGFWTGLIFIILSIVLRV